MRLLNTRRTALPTLEGLEDRLAPAVTYHGGALLQHVEAQAIYLGTDWYVSPALYRLAGQLQGFLNYVVKGPYMDMLARAGYGVGRGSLDRGVIDHVGIDKSNYLTDDAIQNYLQGFISRGYAKAPDANRLYVVFVEPGVPVMAGDGSTSTSDFLGYHNAFSGHDARGNPVFHQPASQGGQVFTTASPPAGLGALDALFTPGFDTDYDSWGRHPALRRN
jgi:hypothetical protein